MLVHPHAVAMIGSKHHNCIVEQSLFFQLADDTSFPLVINGIQRPDTGRDPDFRPVRFYPLTGEYTGDRTALLDIFVFVGNQLISGMRRVHGYDQGKRFACVA